MSALLGAHGIGDLVCFGPEGERDAGQLAAYARAIAAALPAAPVGSHAVLACGDRYHFSAALLACWQRGFVAALPANGQPATVHALELSPQTVAVLHDRDRQRGIDVRAIERSHARAALPLDVALSDDDVAAVAYTSGSTGQPMAHEKSLGQLLREPVAHIGAFGLGGRRIVAAVPPYHIYGLLFGVLVPLLGGGSMSRGAPLLPADLLRELAQHRAEVLVAVPPHLAALVAYAPEAWPPLWQVFSSAAPLPLATARALTAAGLCVTEVLGSTETGGIATRNDPDAGWTPLPGVTVTVAADDALCVDGPWLAPRAPRPVRTADRVVLEDGVFRHLGRSDAVVKVGGRRIDLGELEARLTAVEGVREARVLALESGSMRGVELVAVVAAAAHVDVPLLKRALTPHIDPVAVPRRFRIVPALPRSATGKLARADLVALFDLREFPRSEGDDGTVRFAVPPNSAYFRGHFDDRPILPGVVSLSRIALREARARFPGLGPLTRVTRVKFKRLIGPGEELTLTLTQKGANTVQFVLESGPDPAASGILHFAEAATP